MSTTNAQKSGVDSNRLSSQGQAWLEETLSRLSLEEKVGQMLQLRFYLDYKDFDGGEYKVLREQIKKYHIGSLVCGMHFGSSGPIRSSAIDAANAANRLQADSKLPLLLAADLERGVASRLHDVPPFPWPMAFGAVDDSKTVEQFATITAEEARAVGIQWALAPVADVNNNPANPIINTRSFGENPERVGALVAAFVRGAHNKGLLVTAKHFPGNGDTVIDSHHDVAIVQGDLDHLKAIELPPFQSAIDFGVDSIMSAHVKVPALEPDPGRIATTSPKILDQVLRKQLGFKGLVLTDALEMQGLTKMYDPRKGSPTALAAVDAIKAGNDVIMIPTDLDGAFRAIVAAVRSGEIPESRIDRSVRRILEMKASVGLNVNRFVDLHHASETTSKPEDMAFAQHVADEAVTLVRDDISILPLRAEGTRKQGFPSQPDAKSGSGLLVVLMAEAFERDAGKDFERELKARCPDANVIYFDGRIASNRIPEILQAVAQSERVLVGAYVIHRAAQQVMVDGMPKTYFGMAGPSGKLLQEIISVASDKTAVVSLGSPYLIESLPQIKTYICTYAMTSASEISAVRALFGEIQNHAKLPVTLPGVAPRGFALPWPIQPHISSQLQNTQ